RETLMPIRAVKIEDPERCRYLVRKGAEALALGDRREALARYRAALDYDPEDDRLRATVAELALACGETREGAEELATALLTRPANPEGWNELGVALLENGEREDAERCWRRALAISPGFDKPRSNLGNAPSFQQQRRRAPLIDRNKRRDLFAKRRVRLA